MPIYHTIRLVSMIGKKTAIFDYDTKKEVIEPHKVDVFISEYNKKGYQLTAVNNIEYYLSKRVD